ncbi:MAG: radical SAM protein, partial [Clostridia bacterium]|nr:radical SAM protein [Clostridia bacterium]
RRCAFCTIPLIRGKYVSRALDEIVAEVQHFAQLGVPEYILVAQDVTMYGVDIGTSLVDLLRAITAVDGVKRVRLHYCYPELLTDKLLNEIAVNEKVVKYLDIPFQHCNARILKLMGRRGDAKSYANLIAKIRHVIPGITIRATMMVGFPTETDTEFEELVRFLQMVKLDYVGFFAYSREKGTAAYNMEQVKANVKRKRLRIVEHVQQPILDEKHANEQGQVVNVICDAVVNGVARCRTSAQSPEVDPCIYINQTDTDEPFIVGHEYKIRL